MTGRTDLRPGEVTVAAPPSPGDAALVFIGRIRTPWADPRSCPRQGDVEAGPACRLELDPLWTEALVGLTEGASLQVLYWMHLSRRDLVRQAPRGRKGTIGTFALRSPIRPNPIASSPVRLIGREAPAILVVRGLDCVDGTPLLDIKPDRCPVSG